MILERVPPEDLLAVGRVVRPQGLKGVLRVRAYSGGAGSWLHAPRLYLREDREEPREFRILEVQPHKGALLVQLEGLATIDDAERFRGAEVLIEKSGLSKAEDEYFWYELIDLSVFSESQVYLGKIADIIRTGSNDIYVVKRGDREILIPATYEVVKRIDPAGGKMIVALLEGLLEPDEI